MKFLKRKSIEMKSICTYLESSLLSKGYQVKRKCLDKPWGASWIIGNDSIKKFVREYFSYFTEIDISKKSIYAKVLMIKPNSSRAGKCYHDKSQFWQVIDGEIGIVTNVPNGQFKMQFYKKNDFVHIREKERYRVFGLESYGVVAEIGFGSSKLAATQPS